MQSVIRLYRCSCSGQNGSSSSRLEVTRTHFSAFHMASGRQIDQLELADAKAAGKGAARMQAGGLQGQRQDAVGDRTGSYLRPALALRL